jgi:hypothetical protein
MLYGAKPYGFSMAKVTFLAVRAPNLRRAETERLYKLNRKILFPTTPFRLLKDSALYYGTALAVP